MATASRIPPPVRVLLRRRTWRELLYALLGLPLGVAGFVFTVTTLSVSAGMFVTFVGIPLLALTGLLSRWFGGAQRELANRLIGADTPPPARFRARPGLFGWLGSALSDGTAWRARLYLLLKFPVGMAGFIVATGFYLYGAGGLTYPIWRPFLPCNNPPGDGCHRAINFGEHAYVDNWWQVTVTALVGLTILLLAPWVVRGMLAVDKLLIRLLLGPTAGATRVHELERTRARAVDDQAAALRRIERDLHDGTQARLVALAMNVGRAKEKVAEDPDAAQRLLDDAHRTAKDAIAELRTLVRGIHPPVLDNGLDPALATLAAHSAVPVELRTHLPQRPAPAIETIAYFCAAELLTNVAKHSGARHAWVEARSRGGLLRLTVRDDGRGGATVGAGTGLSGLTERVRTVDGRLSVDSPPGGPTTVTVELPLHT